MSPYDAMAARYAKYPQKHSFEEYLAWHARHGFVFVTPDYFAMGRPVNKDSDPSLIINCHEFPIAECNAWYVHSAAGEIERMFDCIPWDYDTMIFTRIEDPTNELHFHRTETLRRLSATA